MQVSRRTVLSGIAGIGLTPVAGCSSSGTEDPSKAEADVIAGPGGQPRFDPERIAVETGETVTWFFDSSGHNVSGRPGDSEEVSLPEEADPFSTYGPDGSPRALVPKGETYSHTFEAPGTHVYVCIPHENVGMVGRVHVRE